MSSLLRNEHDRYPKISPSSPPSSPRSTRGFCCSNTVIPNAASPDPLIHPADRTNSATVIFPSSSRPLPSNPRYQHSRKHFKNGKLFTSIAEEPLAGAASSVLPKTQGRCSQSGAPVTDRITQIDQPSPPFPVVLNKRPLSALPNTQKRDRMTVNDLVDENSIISAFEPARLSFYALPMNQEETELVTHNTDGVRFQQQWTHGQDDMASSRRRWGHIEPGFRRMEQGHLRATKIYYGRSRWHRFLTSTTGTYVLGVLGIIIVVLIGIYGNRKK